MWKMTEWTDRLHPITIFIYFVCVMAVAMFTRHPFLQVVSWAGSLILNRTFATGRGKAGEFAWRIVFFLGVMIVNPLVYHNGVTVLFYLNGARITLEAVIFGAVMAVTLAGVLNWCRGLTRFMTSDRLIYLLGRISPKASLICSMVLRFVPDYRRKAVQIRQVQQQLGLYGGGSLPERIRGECRVFSAMVTWSFEHSVNTADSMQARGFGCGKRTVYHEYHMTCRDVLLILLSLGLSVGVISIHTTNKIQVLYYPEIRMDMADPWVWTCVICYLLLCLLLPGYCGLRALGRSVAGGREDR